MDPELEFIIPILEILEIEVSNILYNPGNVGKLTFLVSHILEILEICFFYFLISWKYGRRTGGSRGQTPGGLDYFWNMFPGISGYPGNIGNMIFLYFGIFPKKTRAEISRRMHRRMSRDLSYETDSGPKTKTV